MSFQIKAIGLYNKKNKFHSLDFKLNSPNIITGEKDTGKSSVLAIIDYCLCGNTSNGIKDQVFHLVEFYGLHLVDMRTNGEMIVIRQRPSSEGGINERYYIREGRNLEFPEDVSKELQRFDDTSARIKLGLFSYLDSEFCTKDDKKVSIRHPLSLNFLSYADLANEDICFHDQNIPFHFQAFRDFFPYFLGIETIKSAKQHQYKRDLEKDIRNLKAQLKQMKVFTQERYESSVFKDLKDKFGVQSIQDLLSINLDEISKQFTEEQRELDQQLANCRREINSLKKRKDVLENFQDITQLHLNNIVHSNATEHLQNCPLCSQKIDEKSLLLANFVKDIDKISIERDFSKKDVDAIDKQIVELEKKKQNFLEQLAQLPSLPENNSLKLLDYAEFIGGVRQFFKNIPKNIHWEEELRDKEQELKTIEQQILQRDGQKENTRVIDKISSKITETLKEILGNSDTLSIYFDINRLMPVENGKITSGGSSHKISRQISTYLTLHKYFIENTRPVPRFLIVDQFSQGSSGGTADDKKTIVTLLHNIFNIKELQSIILEHIDYSKEDKNFEQYVCQKWENGKKGLLPQSWITDSNEEFLYLSDQ